MRPTGTRSRSIALVASALVACGSASAPSPAAPSANDPPAVELALRTPAGPWLHVGDLRGHPVLLFVFATFDGASQAALRPTSRFARDFPDVHVVGIAAQPNASQLLDPYERALRPPFPLTYDPTSAVTEGTSPLGDVTSVPMYVMLDARGVPCGRHIGFPSTHSLARLRDDALRRGGLRTRERPPPLLGREPSLPSERGSR